MNVGLDCFILKQMFSIFLFIFRNFGFIPVKNEVPIPPIVKNGTDSHIDYICCPLSTGRMRGKRKGTCNADLESAQQGSSLLFEECVAYIGRVSNFTHRNNCNQCEVAVSPKDNKWTPWGNSCEYIKIYTWARFV